MNKRTGAFPVPEADAVVVRSSTQIKNDTEDKQSGNGDDLDGSEDKFGFAISAYIMFTI